MSSAVLSSTGTEGRKKVQRLLEALKRYLEATPDNSVVGTSSGIIELVVRREPDAIESHDIPNLKRQLMMGINAPCWGYLGMTCRSIGDGLIEVKIA